MRTPDGFQSLTAKLGIKDDTPDLLVVGATVPLTCAGVFTQSRFAGPSVVLSRRVARRGAAGGLVVVSKNANVANGATGDADATELQALAAELLQVDADSVAVASTGVIGRPYPMERIRTGMATLARPGEADFTDAASAIMTTDTVAKHQSASVGDATVVGIAKGVGMIEPDMATLLVFFFTDAAIDAATLDAMFRRVCATTFNALSIDTDTSTSDTAMIFSTGLAGTVDEAHFEATLHQVALDLVLSIAADGEGASKVIQATVSGAADEEQARTVAKLIVNSPLVKTAVHGADPNWGRIAMAVGKSNDERIDPDRVGIAIGGVGMYPPAAGEDALAAAAQHLRGEIALLDVDLGCGSARFTAYGCDLTDGYVRINADYTT
jgi:glutamate N-acetyltransferase/amino-acid N-acetyltransferase